MHYMKWIYPRRLRNQMILMAILMVIVPTLTIGYIVETEGRSAVLSEKEKKLSAVVNLLNQALGDRYDLYIDLPREERIRALNAELAPITENITHAFPGIGAGYYNKMLDAIITYAPSALYQNNVGVTIAADHPGREVMRTNTPLVYSGRQVRGDILNSMLPIERNGEILGYIWANELTEDIRRQAWKMDVRIIIVLTAGLLISLLLIVLFSRRLSANIDIITDGLSTLAQNIPTRLPQLPGEMGQISQSVNNLAQALRETRTLNDLIIENAADGVIAIDRQGDVTTMNPAAEVITGYQRHELVGQPYSMLFDNTQFYSPVLDTLEHGTEHVALEISFPGRDRTIELSVTTSRIHNTHGEMIGALVIFSDLTARKETQRRMAQAERLATLGELMAGVAHEVRNPLTAIRGYVQILRQQTSDPIHQEYLSVVLKEIDSINKVIQQLLEFSRPRHSQWQQVSLNALVEETLVLVQTAGVQARVDFISELDNELSPINADRELLKQVLLNILINAVQAISARGEIRIRTWQYSDSQQAISIEDNGCGIDLSLQKKIFDPFFTTKASGTGLGLALSQRIINAHQGDIRTAKIALSQASVLISGESGTGKELIARAIHYNSRRAKGPFIKVNCAALPESLLESELFGHEKGAFTGAQTLRQGLFERANEGTLLLDEIGEMPLVLQAKLLRILQEREFERIGGHQTIKVDIRIIAATNRDLQAMVKEGTFREDLFYRLNVIHLILPPLRDRREDISLLANHFLQKFSSENQRDIIDIDPMAMSLLTAWSWPGNIRELSNVIERAVVMNSGPIIFSEDLPPQIRQPVCNAGEAKTAPVGERNLKEEIKRVEKRIIMEVLEQQEGNRTRTALMLGISRRALMYKLQEYGIDPADV